MPSRSPMKAKPVRLAPIVSLPSLGSQPSFTENSTTAISPTQKPGIE